MSAAQRELLEDLFERWNNGDREFALTEFAPEVELQSALTGRTYGGPDGVREWMGEIDESFETWRLWIDELREPGPDRILALGGVHLCGRASKVEFEQPMSWLVDYSEGLIARVRIFASHEAGVEAAG